MFELTNEQRRCFGLTPVENNWVRIELEKRCNDNFNTSVFIDGCKIVKCIISGERTYREYGVNETVSEDYKYILPKTDKGKSVRLSSSSIQNRTLTGMDLCYSDKYINLYNNNTECSYYYNNPFESNIESINDFKLWIEEWCNETTDKDIEDVNSFSQKGRKHVKYKEGDVFRFKIGRRLYGYGRILLDYDKMRKNKEKFWDILMSKPLVCSVYHIITERKDVSLEELKELQSLPSSIVADNRLYYGEYEIVGNIPVTENEDYPIMYGMSISANEKALCYQCGKTYIRLKGATPLYRGFTNNGVSFNLGFTFKVLKECIENKSNAPYWRLYFRGTVNSDLRNPKFQKELREIKHQMGLESEYDKQA